MAPVPVPRIVVYYLESHDRSLERINVHLAALREERERLREAIGALERLDRLRSSEVRKPRRLISLPAREP